MFEIVALLVGTITTSLIALLVFLKNRHSITNKLFLGLTTGIVGWSVTTYFSLHASSDEYTLFWIRLIMFFVVIQNTCFLLFVRVFPSNQSDIFKRKKYQVAVGYSLITALVAFSPFLFVDFKNGAPVPGPGMILFLPHAVVFTLGGLALLFAKAWKARGAKKVQLQYLLAGTLMMFTLVPLSNFVVPIIFRSNSLVTLSPLYPIIFSMLIAYAIFAKKMFDIRLAVARSLAYILTLVTLLAIYSFVVFAATSFIFDDFSPAVKHTFYLLGVVALVVTFHPLRLHFDRVTDSLFFRHSYKSEEVLDELGDVISNEVSIKNLVQDAMKIISGAMKVTFVSVYLMGDDKRVERKFTVGKNDVEMRRAQIIVDALLMEGEAIVINDDIQESSPQLNHILSQADAALAARLETSKKTIGFIIFGYKQNGDIYHKKDIAMIAVAKDELSVAIQNALRFEEIQKFNETLQAKVDEATAELKRSNEKLKSLDKAKDEFVSMASHQLRTPLTSMKGYVSMVLDGDVGDITPAQRKLLEEAYASSQRMVYLIGDFLNVSRLSTGKFVVEPSDSNVANIVQEEVDQLRATALSRQISLKYEKPSNFPSMVVDETKIRQVVMNFVDNAIFYSKSGSEVKVELTKTAKEVIFKVKDTGIGVPAEERRHLFTKFFRATNARKARPDGTGIGLFMAKKVIVAHSGSIIFETTEGKGSTFGFSLPVDKPIRRSESD